MVGDDCGLSETFERILSEDCVTNVQTKLSVANCVLFIVVPEPEKAS